MRKAIFLAAEAWRLHYGQLATGRKENPDSKLDFKLPSTGETVTLPGWSTVARQGETGDYYVYISPEGEAFDSLEYAYDAIKQASVNTHEKTQAIRAMSRLLADFKEGHSIEPNEEPVESVLAAATSGSKAIGYALSQLDDYLNRGLDPLVKDMSLYIYSMWVYRAERSPFAQDASREQTRKPRHIEIPFLGSYTAAKTWTQRIAKEPRVPKPEGYKFITNADPEMHYLLKAILLRPIYLPEIKDGESTQMLQIRAFRALCTAPDGEKDWPAMYEGPDAPGPFERGWNKFWQEQRPFVLEAQKKLYLNKAMQNLGPRCRSGIQKKWKKNWRNFVMLTLKEIKRKNTMSTAHLVQV